jgi:serine/threonine-protein kinase HipA
MHLKNFSLLREDSGSWRLSDAYDLLPVKLILPEDIEDMALTLNGKKSKINGGDFLAFAKTIGMTGRQTARAMSRIADSLTANMDEVITASPLSDEFAARFQQLVRANLNRINVKV